MTMKYKLRVPISNTKPPKIKTAEMPDINVMMERDTTCNNDGCLILTGTVICLTVIFCPKLLIIVAGIGVVYGLYKLFN